MDVNTLKENHLNGGYRHRYSSQRQKRGIFFELKQIFDEIDQPLFLCIFLLCLFGISVSFISTFNISLKLTGNPHFFAIKQLSVFLGSFASIIVVISFPIEKIFNYVGWIFLFTLVLLLLVFFEPFGREISGTRRWLTIWQFQFQPSEIAKLSCLIVLSHQLTRKKINGATSFINLALPTFIVLTSITGLVIAEPDLSTGLVIFLTGLLLFASSDMPITHIITALVGLSPISIFFLEGRRYFLDRFFFISPDSEPFGRGYHLLQSLSAIRDGKLTGENISNSINRLARLPDAHNDFIFATLANVTGLVGVLVVISLYLFLFVRIIKIANFQKNLSHRFLCLGIGYIISIQSLLHMLVTTGLMPTTGVTLPLISYGGSSMWTTLIMFGVVLRFSRKSIVEKNAVPSHDIDKISNKNN